jgi:hypothetical protein
MLWPLLQVTLRCGKLDDSARDELVCASYGGPGSLDRRF